MKPRAADDEAPRGRGHSGTQRMLGTSDVARALGVSVSTVKRWIDEGVLPAQRSGGGHRRLRGEDVARAVHDQQLPFADLAALVGQRHPRKRLPRQQLLRALKAGRQRDVRQLLGDVRRSGTPMSAIADDLVAPVMHAIGHLCESGTLDISEEHRATHLCAGALHEIRAVIFDRATTTGAPIAVGGTPENDPYMLASLLAEMVLLENGWKVMNLGPHTPLSAFTTAVRRWRPALMWLSISHVPNSSRFVHEFTEFCDSVQRQNPAIILGGRALARELQDALPCGTIGASMTQLSQFARAHLPRKRSRG